MPRVKRRAHRRRTAYGFGHVFQLFCGHDFARPPGFGDDLDAMRTAWPILRADVFAYLEKRRAAGRTDMLRPWGWWEFETPEPRSGEEPRDEADETEREQLRRLGLLEQDACPA